MISLLVVLLIVAALSWVFFFKSYFTQQTGGGYRNITDLSSAYNADAEIAAAMDRMKKNPEKAMITTGATDNQRQIALTFDGLTDRAVMQRILDLLDKYKAKATFFVDGIQTAEDPQTVVNIRKAGHKIENYTLIGLTKMETLPTERLVKDFCRSQKIIKVTSDNGPNLLKANDTKYTDPVLQAAKACGFKSVVKSDTFVTAKNVNSDQAARSFVNKIRPGSIVSVKLKPNPDLIVDEKGKIDLKPAIDKQPGLKVLAQPVDVGEKDIVATVEKLLNALAQEKIATVYVDSFPTTKAGSWSVGKAIDFIHEELVSLFTLRKVYAAEIIGLPDKEVKMIYTTEPALAYSFSGLSNEPVVNDVLNRLKQLEVAGTFFVTELELQQYPKLVRQILAGGHEVGLAIRPKEGETQDQVEKRILSGRKVLQSQYGVKTNLVKQPGGAIADATMQAVSSQGCVMIGQSVTVVQTKHKDYATADQVADEIFPKSLFSLARGQIVHFRMDYYTNNLLVGNLIELIKLKKIDNIAYSTFYDNPENNKSNNSRYTIKPVGTLLSNKKFLYRYPVDLKNVPPQLLKDTPAFEGENKSLVTKLSQRYIGNIDVNDEDRIIDFSKMETRRLDKSGLVHASDNVIFLTFDDWGTDASINKLLYVLRKHNVFGTFFILTRTVLNNPNLLRTMALEGHEIGNHSDQHKPMAVRDPNLGKQVKTQDNRDEYVQELIASFHKLRDVVGDVAVNGKYSLTRFFRPPQLAINKDGVDSVFKAGFEFIVQGSYSTHDYDAKSVAELVKRFKEGIYTENGEVNKGAILVMHMSDTSIYTAVALDLLLTANENKRDSDPTKFRIGQLSDYLIQGYSQIDRKKSLELTTQHNSGR